MVETTAGRDVHEPLIRRWHADVAQQRVAMALARTHTPPLFSPGKRLRRGGHVSSLAHPAFTRELGSAAGHVSISRLQ
jgi:hypothetical protein